MALLASGEIVGTGKAALSKVSVSGVGVRYYDPVTKRAVTGLNQIDKKYYYFDYTLALLQVGTSRFDTSTLSGEGLAVNQNGEILTG